MQAGAEILEVGNQRIVARSEAMRRAVAELEDLPPRRPRAVLLVGEIGSGKDLAARYLHARRYGRSRPFVTMTLDGRIRRNDHVQPFEPRLGLETTLIEFLREGGPRPGTIYVPLIERLPRAVQEGLARLIDGDIEPAAEEVPQVVAATRGDLDRLVTEGRVRCDLARRLSRHVVRMPPLRERVADIGELARELLLQVAEELHRPLPELTAQAQALLEAWPWPGNARELRNVLERVLLVGEPERVDADALPDELRRGAVAALSARGRRPPLTLPLGAWTLAEIEKRALEQALEERRHNQVQAAKLLGISRDTLRYRMRKYGLLGPTSAASHRTERPPAAMAAEPA